MNLNRAYISTKNLTYISPEDCLISLNLRIRTRISFQFRICKQGALSHVWLGEFEQHRIPQRPVSLNYILSTMSNSTSNPPSRASTPSNSRFISNTETLEDALKTQTVGLVHLSEFKKRRVELAEQREREAAEKLQAAHTSRAGTSSREGSEQPPAKKKKRKVVVKGKLSFGGVEDEDEDGTDSRSGSVTTAMDYRAESEDDGVDAGGIVGAVGAVGDALELEAAKKRKVNPKLRAPPPKVLTKNTLLREAQERETLRREFLVLQEKIKNEEISIPFVFYDGMLRSFHIPGGIIADAQSYRNKCCTTRWWRRPGQERGSSMAVS